MYSDTVENARRHRRSRRSPRKRAINFKVSRDTYSFPWTCKFFFFSVFRVVQGEAKTPKIMGCCRAILAFLHALKVGTFRGKWTLQWVFKPSHFFRLALYFFLIKSKLAFLCMFLNDAWWELQKNIKFRAQDSVKNSFCLFVWKPL